MALTAPKKVGKYDVVDVLGNGGMGVVYKAVDPTIGRTVAIKMVTAEVASDPGFRDRFCREARANGNLQHPNIVVVHEFGDQDGTPFLVMEYLVGESLDVVIREKRPLTMAEKLGLVAQVCTGLHYAHENGVIHRDIKPANLRVLRGGAVKILDFGIARVQDDRNITQLGQVIGTIPYMSPEQISGGKLDGRTDVFSTGVVLYELLTFHQPFAAESSGTLVWKIMNEPPPPVSNYLESYPEQLEPILQRALAKSVDDRYPTAQAMALDLIRVQEQLRSEVTTQADLPVALLKRVAAAMDQSRAVANQTLPKAAGAEYLSVSSSRDETEIGPARPKAVETVRPGPITPTEVRPGEATFVPPPPRRLMWRTLAAIIVGAVVIAATFFIWRRTNHVATTGAPATTANVEQQAAKATLPEAISTPTGTMRLVPAGEFVMGSDSGRRSREFGYYNEAPAHRFSLPAFYIDEYEITNSQYKKFCDETGRKYPEFRGAMRNYFSQPNYPVINVSWQDARAYAAWAGKRLPIEAEWEKAARGTDGRRYPWGDQPDPTVILPAGQIAAPVGSHFADKSPYGVMDMADNVAEWVEDSYQLYPGNPAALPADEATQKVVRGVFFRVLNAAETRITNRASAPPVGPEGKLSLIGFRCAIDADTAQRAFKH